MNLSSIKNTIKRIINTLSFGLLFNSIGQGIEPIVNENNGAISDASLDETVINSSDAVDNRTFGERDAAFRFNLFAIEFGFDKPSGKED